MTGIFERRHVLLGGLTASSLALGVSAMVSNVSAQEPSSRKTADHHRVSRLALADVQFLFADLQPFLVAGSKTVSPELLSRSAGVLAKVAQILQIPMLFSVVPEGSGPSHLIAELQEFATKDNTILRRLTGPFMDAATVSALAANRRKTLVIAGFTAEVVVLQAALDAIASGYTVYYVVDAVGSRSERTEAATFREMEQAGAIPTSVLSLTTRLAPDLFTPPGSEAFAALQMLGKS